MRRHYKLTLFLSAAFVIVPAHATLLSSGGSVSNPPTVTGGVGSGSVKDATLTDSPKYGASTCSADSVSVPTLGQGTSAGGANPVITGLGNTFGTGPGTIVADTCVIQASTYYHGAYLTTDFREVVYEEASGTLDFYLQAAVVGTPVAGSKLLDMFQLPFSGVTTNVQTASGVNLLNLSPTSTSGTNDNPTKVISGSGGSPQPPCAAAGNGCISWLFNNLGLDGVSVTMEIQTNATSFTAGGVGFDSTNDIPMDPLAAFAPVAPVPEPMSIIMLGTVLAVGAAFIRRRHKAKSELSVS